MGEIIATTSNWKGSSPLTIQCPLLNDTNYTMWTMQMKMALTVHKVWEIIDPGEDEGEGSIVKLLPWDRSNSMRRKYSVESRKICV